MGTFPRSIFRLVFISSLLILSSCTRAPIKERKQAMRMATRPFISDDLGAKDFLKALEAHVLFLEKAKLGATLSFGPVEVPVIPYVQSLRALVDWSKAHSVDGDALWEKIAGEFEFLEVYGTKSWGRILLTSYFEPEFAGSLTPTPEFSQPIYRAPNDMIDVNISAYDERFRDVGTMKGRMAMDERLGKMRMVPYYSRTQIDGPERALKGKNLELCYANPVDSFFMQVQGSGTVQLPDGKKMRLGYADQNGHKYHSIGKFLTDVIPLEKITLFTLETHLKALPEADARSILFKNPSYVFFRPLEGPALTSLGNEVFAGRTIATDVRYFPKGALAFLQFRRPVFSGAVGDEVSNWQEVSRFVFDQDTGGAIRGGGRADLFWGSGMEAKRFAGVIKDDRARLYYLVPSNIDYLTQGVRE